MKYLIVNADDFGASRGINRGILEAHQRGILSSTSLMVNRAASEEAALVSVRGSETSVDGPSAVQRHRPPEPRRPANHLQQYQ